MCLCWVSLSAITSAILDKCSEVVCDRVNVNVDRVRGLAGAQYVLLFGVELLRKAERRGEAHE